MVLLSSVAIEPYKPVTTLENDITISRIKDASVSKSTDQHYLYLIVEDEWYDTITIKVENENATGIGLYISLADAMGKPLKWQKHITFDHVYANGTTLKFSFLYKWTVIDDIFLINDKQAIATLNIYGYKQVIT